VARVAVMDHLDPGRDSMPGVHSIMIFSAIFYVAGWLLSIISALWPATHMYPQQFTDAMIFFGQIFQKINFFIDAQSLAHAIIFVCQYFSIILIVKIILFIFGFFKNHNQKI
jgi:hypothetical protein